MPRVSKRSTVGAATQAAALTQAFLKSEIVEINDDGRELSSASPCVVYECSGDLTVLAVSPSVAELLGIARERLLGNSALWNERLLSEDRGRLLARLKETATSSVVPEVHRLIDDQGLPVWVGHSFRRVGVGPTSKILGCIIPLPREFNENGLHPASVSQFVHKIGNHFQLINLLLGSLRRSAKSPDEIESLEQAVERATELTRAFLHYSQAPSAMADVDLGEVLRAVVYLYVPRFAEKNVKFQDLAEDALDGTLVFGDAFSLELAFGAILQNALDATHSGDLVTMSAERHMARAGSHSVARISIVDSGAGIDPQLLAKVAVPFYSTKPEGDGLGLSLAMRVIDCHGGLLKISSAAGRGTGIDIALPVNGPAGRLDP